MSLSPGTRLGPYEIVAPLGAGGMGEVYRARDTRLGREVAVKVLPESLSSDRERLARFEQEARSASALNHPNIVTIHDVGQAGGTTYIAMELVQGKTVGELIAAGPMPVRRLLSVASQVAGGLAKAHASGIVHRDLKPENLMVTDDGFVKILDFGLAKLVADSSDALSQSPTMARPQTRSGAVMGTVGYMSPEQAAGQPLDFRSDQFSLGSILYEMATGRRAFLRATAVDTLSAILHEEPEPVGRVNPSAPPPLRWIVERCLAKDPRERYASTIDLARDIASVREHISELSGEAAVGARPKKRGRRLRWIAAAGTLLLGLAAGFLFWGRRTAPAPARVMRLNMVFSSETSPVLADSPTLALSPDGSRVVYVGRGPRGSRLYVRALDRFDATPIPDTDEAVGPFFSPDGDWVGFVADRNLKKVSLAGGKPLTICDSAGYRGASWGADGTILFSPYGRSPLYRVSDRGGEPKAVTTLEPSRNEFTHRWPRFLPGGKAAIFAVHSGSGNYDTARIDLLMLETGQRRTLLERAADARYVPTGHLVYLRSGSLFAAPFDLARLRVTGSPVPVLDGLAFFTPAGFAFYDFSAAGSLAYLPLDPKEFEKQLVWVNRTGAATPVTDERRPYAQPRLSPDGKHLAVSIVGAAESDIWILDLARKSWDRLTSGGLSWSPVWSGDGKRIAFASNQAGTVNPFSAPVDHSAGPERLMQSETWADPTSWSPDGRSILIEKQYAATGSDLFLLSVDGKRTLRPLLGTPANENDGRFSRDGRSIAYVSDETGRGEVYVTEYPGSGGRVQISTAGGSNPVWSGDGRELFFKSGGKLMAAAVDAASKFQAGPPRALFELGNLEDFDVAADGRFLFDRSLSDPASPRPLAIVLNWFDDLKRRAAANKN